MHNVGARWRDVLVIAHRGASAVAAGNTLDAFRRARDLGADWVELDVRRTADGTIAVVHDAVLPDARRVVDLTRADLPAWVPDLAAALDACGGMGVNVEVKNHPADADHDPDERLAAAVVRLVAEAGARERVLVSSFSAATVARVRQLDPDLPTAWLVLPSADPDALVARAAGEGHRALHPRQDAVDARLVGAAHDAGLRVHAWTVDDPVRIAALVAAGADGVVTNVPDVARRVIDGARW